MTCLMIKETLNFQSSVNFFYFLNNISPSLIEIEALKR